MSNRYQEELEKRRKRQSRHDKAVALGGAAVIGFIILINLAFLALISWGIYELVVWVTSK